MGVVRWLCACSSRRSIVSSRDNCVETPPSLDSYRIRRWLLQQRVTTTWGSKWHRTHTIQRSIHTIQRSTHTIQRSTHTIQRSVHTIQRRKRRKRRNKRNRRKRSQKRVVLPVTVMTFLVILLPSTTTTFLVIFLPSPIPTFLEINCHRR